MNVLNWIKKYINFVLFPIKCVICNKKSQNYICNNCKNYLKSIFKPKIVDSIRYELTCVSCFEYKNEIRDIIHKFKFKNCKDIALVLSDFLYLGIKKIFKDEKIDLVTFVPIFPSSQDDLKYNHSEILAKKVAKKLGKPIKNCLKKIYNNKKQHKLSFYERQKNVKNVYKSLENFKNKKILICDDIITTGSTLLECKTELEKSGAKVLCATVAFTVLDILDK
ncbi:MAG: ComF family protein [Clostridia bacterium]|nr:ComF family protein [Clostridia bacterium]